VNDLAFLAEVMVSVFALVDPIGTLPFYVALTQGFPDADRREVVRRAVVVVGVILTLFALVGRFLFAAFGFSLGAFEIAGGMILFLVAYDMIRGEMTRTKLSDSDRSEALARPDDVAVVPLGIPLLAGPGAISTVMIYEGNTGGDPFAIAATFLAIAVTTALTFVILWYGASILRRVGPVGVGAIARVMGLLLAAVAVQFVLNGVVAVLPSV
jgi:multiple antibiotic resistance protein